MYAHFSYGSTFTNSLVNRTEENTALYSRENINKTNVNTFLRNIYVYILIYLNLYIAPYLFISIYPSIYLYTHTDKDILQKIGEAYVVTAY